MSLYVLVREQQLVGTGLDSKTYLTIKRYTRETSLRKIMDRALSAVQTPISKGEKIIPFWIYGYELPGQKQNVFGIFADVISTTANMHDKRVREQHDAWTSAAGPMKLRGDAVAFRLAACALSELLRLELRWDEHFEKLLAEQDNFSYKKREPVIVEEQPQASAEPINHRAVLLDEVRAIVTKDRNKAYGNPEDNFQNIADFWNVYLRIRYGAQFELIPEDVAMMHMFMKGARLTTNIHHRDSWVDTAGYAACGYQCSVITQEKDAKQPS